MATPEAARVGVVVVTYDNAAFVGRCLDALLATTWPAGTLEVVVVDNGSQDGTPELVARDFPQVRLLRSPRNLGFGGGCNLGLAALGDVRYAALVNSDLFVPPGWLAPMVAAQEADRHLGAVSPKVVLEPRFAEVVLRSPTFRSGGGDERTLGLRVVGVEVAGRDRWDDVVFASGWSWDEGHARWSTGEGVLWVPADEDLEVVVTVDGEATPRRIVLGPERFDVLNNVGNVLTAGGYGADRGWLERDRGQYDEPAEVFAWYGGCTLLRAAYLHDVGGFDEPLFLYYEDLDLAWRGRRRGWRYATVPEVVVRHHHRGSTRGDQARFEHLNHRNRLVVLSRHLGRGAAVAAWGRYLRDEVGGNARGEVLTPLRRGARPHPQHTTARLRAAAGALRLLVRELRTRERAGR